MSHRLWILAEPEPFLLPHLAAQLASAGLLEGIIEMSFVATRVEKARRLRRWIRFFGIKESSKLAWAVGRSWVRDLSLRDEFHSLAHVATRFGIQRHSCCGFLDPSLEQLLTHQIQDKPILVQVGRKVPARMVADHLMLNKHCSMLPARPGVFPVFWSMLCGDTHQGVTIHRMGPTIDSGPIWAQNRISNQGDFFALHRNLYDLSFDLLRRVLTQPLLGPLPDCPTNSPSEPTCPWPQAENRRRFLSQGLRFGQPLVVRHIHSLSTEYNR